MVQINLTAFVVIAAAMTAPVLALPTPNTVEDASGLVS